MEKYVFLLLLFAHFRALHLFVFGGKSEKFVSISSWILLNFFIVSLLLFLFLHKKVLIFHHFIDVEFVVLLLKTWMHLTFLLLIYLRLFLLSSNSCHSELFCIAWPGVGVCSIGLLSKVLLVLKLNSESWEMDLQVEHVKVWSPGILYARWSSGIFDT